MSQSVEVALEVDGEAVRAHVAPRTNLADFLRGALGLTGTHVGCEHGVCGACTLMVDGAPVRACLMLAVQARGASVTTIEGLARTPTGAALAEAFAARNALQCGFCTPGMIATAADYLDGGGAPDREAIRAHLSGNYCRCTGYHAIVDAVIDAHGARA